MKYMIYMIYYICIYIYLLYWAQTPSGQSFVATSKDTSVANSIYISSFRYTHVITSRKFRLK